MDAKETLTTWLEDGDIERVLTGLKVVCNRWGHKDLATDISFQTSRYKVLKEQQAQQTISQPDFQLESAKIRKAVFDLINSLADHWTSDGLENTSPTKSLKLNGFSWKKWGGIIAITIAFFGAVEEFSGFSLRDFFNGDNSGQTVQPPTSVNPTNFTSGTNSPIIIHNSKGDVNYNAPVAKDKTVENDSIRNK